MQHCVSHSGTFSAQACRPAFDSLSTIMEAPRSSDHAVQDDSFEDLYIERHDHDHDQLPNAEELKSSMLPTSKRRRTLLLIGIVGVVVFLVILIPLSVHYNQNNAQSTQSSSPRFQQTTAFLLDYVDQVSLSTPGSPQRRAAEWMAEVDELQLPLNQKTQAFLQRYALATIFYATQGDIAWAHKLKFLSGVQECGWNVHFTGDNNSTFTMGVLCNNDDDSVSELLIRK